MLFFDVNHNKIVVLHWDKGAKPSDQLGFLYYLQVDTPEMILLTTMGRRLRQFSSSSAPLQHKSNFISNHLFKEKFIIIYRYRKI